MSDTIQNRRLDFFWNMVSICGLNRGDDLARLAGVSQPAVQNWWKVDDLSLSHILDIAEKLNVKIDFALTRKSDSEESTPLYVSDVIKQAEGRTFVFRRLEFIELALRRYGIFKTEWARAIKTGHVTVYQWFTKDDIMWSRVCQLANIYDLDIHVSMSTNIKRKPEERNGPCTIVTMTREYDYNTPEVTKKK